MVLRKRIGPTLEKENDCRESNRTENSRLTRANGRSPINQRRRDKARRNSLNKRDAPHEPLTESFIREGSAVDGFLLAQRNLRSKLGNAFQHLREHEVRNKDTFDNDVDGQDETSKSRRRSSTTRRPSSTKRSSRSGAEKRKHFQEALMELKPKMWKSGKETNSDCFTQQNVTQGRSGETQHMQTAVKSASDRLPGEPSFHSSQFAAGPMSAWLSRPGKQQRSSVESPTGKQRKSPLRIDHSSRGGSGFFGSSVMQFPSPPCSTEDYLDHPSSLDTKIQWGRKSRRQPRRRNVPLRRTKSSNSLQPQRGSGFILDIPDLLVELTAESSLLDQIQELRTSLERSEKALNHFIEESKKNRAKILEQLERLTSLYSSLSQSQDIRYRSLLDVFHENYKLLGYVESNFDYVLSVVARGKRSNLQGRFYEFLRFIADYTMAPILCVVRFGTRLYLRLFPRGAEPNG